MGLRLRPPQPAERRNPTKVQRKREAQRARAGLLQSKKTKKLAAQTKGVKGVQVPRRAGVKGPGSSWPRTMQRSHFHPKKSFFELVLGHAAARAGYPPSRKGQSHDLFRVVTLLKGPVLVRRERVPVPGSTWALPTPEGERPGGLGPEFRV